MGSGLGKKTASAIEKIGELEKGFIALLEGVQNAIGTQNNQLGDQGEALAAVIDILGKEQVNAKIVEKRKITVMDQVEKAKAALAMKIAEGTAKPVDIVTETALIVGKEYDDKGEVKFPGRLQVMVSQLKPEAKEAIIGKPANFSVTLPDGTKLEVNEAYELVKGEPTEKKSE